MISRLTPLIVFACGASASTWTTIGGGYEIWIEGEYASLAEPYEETWFEPDDTSEAPYFTTYSQTPYRIEGSVIDSSWLGNEFVVVGPDTSEITFEIHLVEAPEGMQVDAGDYEEQYRLQWTAPYVYEATEFSFTLQAKVFQNAILMETLEGELTITVLPAIPMLDENLLTQGIRSNDGGDQYDLYLDVYDPDEDSDLYQLTLETQDPRFTFEVSGDDDWLTWTLRWNQNHPVPLASEMIPLKFWMRDWDGSAERWTSVERDLMVFGYTYESYSINAPTPEADALFGKTVELMDTLPGQNAVAFIQDSNYRVQVYEQTAPNADWRWQQSLISPEGYSDFGGSLASVDDILAVGCAYSDPNYALDSRVYLYRRSAETGLWSLKQTLIPDDEALGGVFGGKVALDRNLGSSGESLYTLMISADGAKSQGEHTGAVWVYEAADTKNPIFEKSQIILPEDAEAGDYFGWPLALYGDIAAIPSNEDDDIATDSGAVYVYRRNTGSGLWEQRQKLKANDAQHGDLFGERVSISDRGIFVSAFRKKADNSRVGAVYQFELSSNGWGQTRRIRTVEEQSSREYIYYDYGKSLRKEYTLRQFGASLVANGDTLLVCGQRQGYGWLTLDRSVVYQFVWDEASGEWIEMQALCSQDSNLPNTAGEFGSNLGNLQALAVQGDVILAGDLGADASNLPDSGKVYCFSTVALPTPITSTETEYFDTLALLAPSDQQPEDDADGDGKSNLIELYTGSSPIVHDSAPAWSSFNSDYPSRTTFSYLASQKILEARPQILYSRTLETNSWQNLPSLPFLPDVVLEDSVRKTVDLSSLMLPHQSLFLKLKYPKTD